MGGRKTEWKLFTSPQSWGTTTRHDLPLRTASHRGHWHPLRISACSLMPPFAIRWSADRNVLHWKWRHRCTNHQLRDKDPRGGRVTREETITQIVSNLQILNLTHRKVLCHADLQTGPLRSGLVSWAWFVVPASTAFLVAATGSSSLHQPSLWKTALTLHFRGCCHFLLHCLTLGKPKTPKPTYIPRHF